MAKRAEQLQAQAEDRKAKAEIMTLKSIKRLTIELGDIRRVRETKPDGSPGRVIKQVHLLRCSCLVEKRIDPIRAEIEMEAGDNWGVDGELKQAVAPAVAKFLDFVATRHRQKLKEAEAPLGDAPPPLPSQRPPSEAVREVSRSGVAARQAKKSQPATRPPSQFDEADEPNPETEGGEA